MNTMTHKYLVVLPVNLFTKRNPGTLAIVNSKKKEQKKTVKVEIRSCVQTTHLVK